MKRYRVDIFDRQFNYVDMSQTSEPTLISDILCQTASQFSVPKKLTVHNGDFCQVKGDNNELFQGIVTDFSYDGNVTTVTLSQLSQLLDVDVFADISDLANGIEQFMVTQLGNVYNGTDTYQNLTGLTFVASTTTAGSYEPNDDNIYNLYDLSIYFFKVYGIITSIYFDVGEKKIYFSFKLVDPSTIWKIETKLKDVADYTVKSASTQDNANKAIIRNKDNPSESVTYYWHPTDFAGTIDTDSTTNRVLPVRLQCATVTVDVETTFSQVSYETAYEMMYQSRYEDQIEITFNSASKLVSVGEIGQLYTVIDGDKQYNTILTGYQRLNDKYTLMTFGFVRQRLTQILQLDRRRRK